MYLNKMSRTSRKKMAHNIKDPAVYLTVGMGYFYPCLHQTHLVRLLPKNYFFLFQQVSSDHRNPVPFYSYV